MANPRQRRKLRSGSHKPVHHSSRAKKILRKQPPIHGPRVLQEAWDKNKTVQQNYQALGLIASLNPTASGGTERLSAVVPCGKAPEQQELSQTSRLGRSSAQGGIPRGFGRIVRDENGNVVDIELGEEETEMTGQPEAQVMEDIIVPTAQDRSLAAWVGLSSSPNAEAPQSRVVQALEKISESRKPVARFTSPAERALLRGLIAKYKDDVGAMSRDRKLNPDQRTAGELSRAIKKAGGAAELMRKV